MRLCRDFSPGDSGADYRVFYLFSGIVRDAGCALVVFGAISGKDACAPLQLNVFAAPAQDRYDYIDLLTYWQHMYRPRPSDGRPVHVGHVGIYRVVKTFGIAPQSWGGDYLFALKWACPSCTPCKN